MIRRTLILMLAVASLTTPATAFAATPSLERISQTAELGPGDGYSGHAAISADGSTMAFVSLAANLVEAYAPPEGQCCPHAHVYVRDMKTGDVRLVSRAEDGSLANDGSYELDVSDDGRLVVFKSSATNLVEGTSGARHRIFVKNLETGKIRLASHRRLASTSENPRISGNGRYVLFDAEVYRRGAERQVYLRDLETDELTLVSRSANGEPAKRPSTAGDLSADGRYVAYQTAARHLAGSHTPYGGIVVKDMKTGTVHMVHANDSSWPYLGARLSMSADGRRLVFDTHLTELVADSKRIVVVVAADLDSGKIQVVSQTAEGVPFDGTSGMATISDDGRHVAFWSKANTLADAGPQSRFRLYLKDLETGKIDSLSPTVDLPPEPPKGRASTSLVFDAASLSRDARHIIFNSDAPIGGASRISQVYLHKRR